MATRTGLDSLAALECPEVDAMTACSESRSNDAARSPRDRFLRGFVAGGLGVALLAAVFRAWTSGPDAAGTPGMTDPSPVFVPVLMRELGNSPRGVS
jgi:hypothetical protein